MKPQKPSRPNKQPPKDHHADHHDDHDDHDDHHHHMDDHDHDHYDDDHYHSDHSAYDHDHYGDKTPYAKNPYGASEANAYGAGYDDGTGLHCWTCHADSFDLCGSSGHLQKCQHNEESCELEIRERKGFILQVMTGCKAADACKNNMANNFSHKDPALTQCRPEGPSMGYNHSVCRQCCSESNCVKSPDWWYPTSRAEWAYTGEEEAYPAPY